jgi:hypothetical protein
LEETMTIFGWDMSHFDAPGIGAAVAEGISFTTHKAGGDKDDPEIGTWWAGVHGLDPGRVLLGAYWVLFPGNPAGRADAFLARLDATCPGWRDRPFLLQADCEKWNNDPATVPGLGDIQAFCGRLAAQMPKLRPVVYAPKWVYGDGLVGLRYPLWASSYVTGTDGFRALYPGDGSSRWAGYSGQTPAILQYSSSATIGGQTTSDANAYRGTLAELVALAAPGWSDDMELTSDNLQAIAKAVWGSDIDPSTNGYTAGGALWTALGRTGAINDAVRKTVDPAAIAQAVVAALPPGPVEITPEELQDALLATLRKLIG